MSKPSPVKLTKSQINDLTLLIARMQKNADRVEKNILQSEKQLAADSERDAQQLPWTHQKDNAQKLAEAEGLLKDLFMDVDKAKKLQHPQAGDIEKDVKNLHDRWVKDCGVYRDLYDKVQDVDLTQKIDWAQLLEQKLKVLQSAAYGPKLSDVEKQTAAHNILHKEIQAYSVQLQPPSAGPQEQFAALREKYAAVLESSERRRQHLASLYEYMQMCSKELVYLAAQQERILQRDWSDRMGDPRGVRMEYEKFKANALLAHESEVQRLRELGDRLVERSHPGSPTVKAHRDTVQAEWEGFLNLCLAQETHLDNVDEYKKFQLDAETLSDSLEKLASTLDPKSLDRKSNSEVLLTLEGEEPALRRSEQRLAALRELSGRVAPLKLRRTRPSDPPPVVSLCDWVEEEDSVRRGDEFLLKSNAAGRDWKLQTSGGQVKTFPGACFLVPPPDPEALERVSSLQKALTELKSRRAVIAASARSSNEEVVRTAKTAAVQSAPEDPRAAELSSELDRINRALLKVEKEILSRLRAPLDPRDPTQDLANRLQEHEEAAVAAKKLESDKAAVQREVDPILAKKPPGPGASTLPPKLSAANNKINDINALLDLYNKKATASMFLEKQIQNVDGAVSGFEEQLAKDGVVPDQPHALQSRKQQLQNLRKDVGVKKSELTKLGRELELAQQACGPLQRGFGEFCPDLRRQENEVKRLRSRYLNVESQLQDRIDLMKEASNRQQDFSSAALSLDFFLVNLPNNSIKPTDGVAQITAKQNAQRKVTQDVQKKWEDLERVGGLSRDLQTILNTYEVKSGSYRATLRGPDEEDDDEEDGEGSVFKKTQSMAEAVQRREQNLRNLYSEVSAENEQLLQQLDTAKSIMARNEERVSEVAVNHQMQLQSQQRALEQSDTLKKELNEETDRRRNAEKDLELYRKRFVTLKSRRGVERVEEKEVVQYYRDPKLEAELQVLENRIREEATYRASMQAEMETSYEKMTRVELQLTQVKPKLVTKVLTEYERDPQLDKEAAKIRDEMERIRQELQTRSTEAVTLKSEITVLAQQRPRIREKVVKKEVVRVEKDPEMLKAVLAIQAHLAEEEARCEALNGSVFSTRSQINALERDIPTIQPKVVSKVVKQVQQDPETVEEFRKLQMALGEEKDENAVLTKDLSALLLRREELEKLRPKVELKEVISETFRVDPETDVELMRLRKELQDCGRQRSELEKEINSVLAALGALRTQKPKVEYKEVTQEVIKEEKSPEVVRELQRLSNQASRLQVNHDTVLELLTRLRKERDELKEEKSRVETTLVTREVVKYENDPLLEKEADRLRRNVRDEIQQRRGLEECLFDLQNQFITLERQKPEEKVVTQQVVRLQKDPQQVVEHEKLNRSLDEETKARRKLELEVRQLRAVVQERESALAQTDDRQKKIQAEAELRRIKARILDLEGAPPPVEEKIVIEEVLKVERDPKLEKLSEGIRGDLETEATNISRLEKEIRNLRLKLEILHKDKSAEKVVYREVVRVEKDPAVEAERERLRDLVTQERNLRRAREETVQNLGIKLAQLQTWKSASARERSSLAAARDALQREKEELLRQLQALESDRQSVSVSFQQQTRRVGERNRLARQRSVKASAEIERLEKEILNEKDVINQRAALVTELQGDIRKEDQSGTQTREVNVSTTVSIVDPHTGEPLAPCAAYERGLIDREHFIYLSGLECDWEEITSTGPEGDSMVLEDRKTGEQYAVQDALREGRLTQHDVSRYKEGKMSVTEFGLLLKGEIKPPSVPPKITPRPPPSPLKATPPSLRSSQSGLNRQLSGSLSSLPSSLRSSYGSLGPGDEHFPISGVYDTTTQSRMSVRSALTRRLIDVDTALKLLEAQAASGGIVDLTKKDKLSVHKAAECGLIDGSHTHKLLNAQKAFTGVEDPVSKRRLAVGEAARKGYIPPENAQRYMEAQYLTGGLVNPSKAGRLSVQEALDADLIDEATAARLRDEASHSRELTDPVSKEQMSYKQAMDRCRRDVHTGLLLLPAASSDATDAPSYSSYRFNSSYGRY